MLGTLTLYSHMLCWCPSLSPPTTRLQMHNRHFTARLGVMEPGWACWDGSPPDGVKMGDLVGFTRPRGLKYDTPAATATHRFSFCFGRWWDADFACTEGCVSRCEWMKTVSRRTSNKEGLCKSSSYEHYNNNSIYVLHLYVVFYSLCSSK